MPGAAVPASTAQAALRIFQSWFGARYARSFQLSDASEDGGVLAADARVGRQWSLQVTVADTFAASREEGAERARAAVEARLDASGRPVALWVPRGAPLPTAEPGLSRLALAVEAAGALEDGRLELRRPVEIYLRRTLTTGSVVTVLGGLGASWAQFTNRVPGTFQLDSRNLFRLPHSREARDELAERIVLAAGQPDVDESVAIPADDTWTANLLAEGPSCVFWAPQPESDDQSAALRRELRVLLRRAAACRDARADARALVVLGAADYADEEKLSWALRGMDPTLYSGYELVTVLADGLVKPLLLPGRGALPWDAPLPGQA